MFEAGTFRFFCIWMIKLDENCRFAKFVKMNEKRLFKQKESYLFKKD